MPLQYRASDVESVDDPGEQRHRNATDQVKEGLDKEKVKKRKYSKDIRILNTDPFSSIALLAGYLGFE